MYFLIVSEGYLELMVEIKDHSKSDVVIQYC